MKEKLLKSKVTLLFVIISIVLLGTNVHAYYKLSETKPVTASGQSDAKNDKSAEEKQKYISDIKKLNAEKEELQTALDEAEKKSSELSVQKEQQQTTIDSLTGQINSYKTQVDGLSGQVTSYKSQIAEKDSAIAQLQAQKSGSSSSGTNSSVQTSSYTVYITKTGSKYHRSGCRYLSRSQISISKSDAVAQGYDACSVCNP